MDLDPRAGGRLEETAGRTPSETTWRSTLTAATGPWREPNGLVNLGGIASGFGARWFRLKGNGSDAMKAKSVSPQSYGILKQQQVKRSSTGHQHSLLYPSSQMPVAGLSITSFAIVGPWATASAQRFSSAGGQPLKAHSSSEPCVKKAAAVKQALDYSPDNSH